GHIVLSRDIAARGRFPAVDVPASISRVMDAIVSKEQVSAARRLRGLLGLYEQKRDLVLLGAYAKGSDARLDAAITLMPELERFLGQAAQDVQSQASSAEALLRLAQRVPASS
ncbi:MAG TPA: EscN/YscN/HrcN family type III secretion system ATPase, partial [Polyangiaceae bacterium]|nr:EscN/YscN/HrcN family type III secretion system ATPase [Polyangiaceae bacterium]